MPLERMLASIGQTVLKSEWPIAGRLKEYYVFSVLPEN